MTKSCKSRIAGIKLRLGRPDVAEVIDEKHAAERDSWRTNRLLAVKLTIFGEVHAC